MSLAEEFSITLTSILICPFVVSVGGLVERASSSAFFCRALNSFLSSSGVAFGKGISTSAFPE